MEKFSTVLRGWAGRILRPTYVPAAIAAIVVTLFGLLAANQQDELDTQRVKADVVQDLGLIRARLEGNIQGDILLARGLAAAIATEPDMTQERFAALASNTLGDQHHQIRHVAGAPDLVVSMIYPVEGNRQALGLDYRSNESQREAAMRARDEGRLVLAGPVDLVQGGQGFIVRLPIFTSTARNAASFWGILSIVIDVEELYAQSGLVGDDLPIDVAIVGRDALGAAGAQFFGDPQTLQDDPITETVVLPWGSWHLAAVPRGGWAATRDTHPLLWIATLVAGLLVVVPTGLTGRLVDERRRHVAELKSREVTLERLSRRLEMALDTSKVGVWEFEPATGELYWDARMNELYGYPQDGGPREYAHWQRRLSEDGRERAEEDYAAAIRNRGSYHSQFRIEVGGSVRTIRAIGSVHEASNGVFKIVGLNWDVSLDVALTEDLRRAKSLMEARNVELEAVRARIEHNSLHDFLTGLPNRMFLDKVLEEHARRGAVEGGGIVLLHLDLDRFKEINDTLGHAAGDAMLIQTAAKIRANLDPEDFVARTGGDEFLIVCPAGDGLGRAPDLASRLIETMQVPVQYEGQECRFGVSVGIAGATGSDIDRERLLVNADIALYRAKHRGRNRFEIFTTALQAQIVSRKQTADSILKGLENREFVPFFQPQFDARTFTVVGVEALARWQHPERGIVAPDAFVQIAEEINALAEIDRMILEQSLEEFDRWKKAGLGVPRVSVNVSARRLHDEGLIDALKRLDFEPGTLAFELVESIYLDESDESVRSNISALRDIGIHIEIDDFGTGYASVVSLMKLRPQRLKIDRQIVQPITSSASQVELVKSIVQIGKSLQIGVVAEGVETMQHARILRSLGCDLLQGYALARPMPADDFARFVASRGNRAAS